MPGRAVVTSPGGTAAISIPSEPNFMWTGLVTCAPFLGSMKNTLGFFLACAPADTLNALTIATTSSASCFQLCMATLLWHILAEQPSKPSSGPLLGQASGCRRPHEDPARHGTRERFVRRRCHNR